MFKKKYSIISATKYSTIEFNRLYIYDYQILDSFFGEFAQCSNLNCMA